MFSGPMFRWERQSATRKRRPFLFRTVFAICLGVAALLAALWAYSWPSEDPAQVRIVYFGRSLVVATIVLELVFLTFFVPSHVGGAIAEEREKDTLPMLLLTRLTPIEIVLTKWAARWMPAASLIFTGLPVLLAGGWLAGLESEAALAIVGLLTSSLFMAALAILASARRGHVMTARGEATGWTFGWLVGLPIVAYMPVATGSLWGDLIYEAKRLCSLASPSSPMSLLTDPGWYYRANAMGLGGRVALMVGLQALFGAIALGLAAGSMQAREKNPNSADPTRGHRPRCGDDPIFWREYELPIRRGAGSLFVIQLRYALILVRAVLLSLLGLVGVLFVIAVPVGLAVAAIYYGGLAFGELREHGYGPGGPFVARSHFGMLVRAATGLLGFLPGQFAAGVVLARITAERDKKTWDAFLTTPLTGEEILRSKARVAAYSTWLAARPLPLLWALGLILGAMTPIGVALAAVDLALVSWASIALGLYLAFRPGSTAVAANNRSALVTLASFAFHGPLIYAALASPREIAMVDAWDPRLRWLLALLALAIMAATALLGRRWSRITLANFEEWAGRPIRPASRTQDWRAQGSGLRAQGSGLRTDLKL